MKLHTSVLAAVLLVAALGGGAMVSAQTADETVERRRVVDDWLVEYVAESDGGLVVRMSREGDNYRLRYHEAFWRGNYGPIRRFAGERGDCGGVDEGGAGADTELDAGELRRRLAGQLAGCGADAREVAAALQGFERAFALASAWAGEAAAATAAEAAAIAAYGEDANMTWDGAPVMNATDALMDADVTMDESDWTNSIEPESKLR